MTASVHELQFVHSATSMIMFHFFIAYLVMFECTPAKDANPAIAACRFMAVYPDAFLLRPAAADHYFWNFGTMR
jgi:hypothetical protein